MAQIQVTGIGRVSVTPDQCVVNMHARKTAPTAREALDASAALAEQVIDVLEAAGIASEDRRASPSGVHRETRWQGDREVFLGWSASYQMHGLVRDITLAYQLVEQISEIEGVDTNGPHWQVDHHNPAHSEARRSAVEDARAKALDYATASGLDLGPLISLSDGTSGFSEPRPMARGMLAEASGVVEPGTQEVTAMVTLTFSAE